MSPWSRSTRCRDPLRAVHRAAKRTSWPHPRSRPHRGQLPATLKIIVNAGAVPCLTARAAAASSRRWATGMPRAPGRRPSIEPPPTRGLNSERPPVRCRRSKCLLPGHAVAAWGGHVSRAPIADSQASPILVAPQRPNQNAENTLALRFSSSASLRLCASPCLGLLKSQIRILNQAQRGAPASLKAQRRRSRIKSPIGSAPGLSKCRPAPIS